MACVCCYYKDGTLIAAQILSVIAFLLSLWGHVVACVFAGISMILLLTSACCNVQVSIFYTAAAMSGIAIIGEIFTIVFVDEIIENDCENDDGSLDDNAFCEESNIIATSALDIVVSILVVWLALFFAVKRYQKIRDENGPPNQPTTVIVLPSEDVIPKS